MSKVMGEPVHVWDGRTRCEVTNKVHYESQLEVIRALAEVRRKNHNECRYYLNEECGGWHLTSQKNWRELGKAKTNA